MFQYSSNMKEIYANKNLLQPHQIMSNDNHQTLGSKILSERNKFRNVCFVFPSGNHCFETPWQELDQHFHHVRLNMMRIFIELMLWNFKPMVSGWKNETHVSKLGSFVESFFYVWRILKHKTNGLNLILTLIFMIKTLLMLFGFFKLINYAI